MPIPSGKPVSADADSAKVSHGSAESDNIISLALRANGQERANVEQHSVENQKDPLQSPCVAKKDSAQAIGEGDFAQDAGHRMSEGSCEHLGRRASDIHELGTTDGGRQELERLAASVRSIQR